MKNPFRPTAGATPPEIIGRAGLLDDFEHGLEMGPGASSLMIFSGPRGVGKTVMLGAAQDRAREHGWAVIAETATTGFVARIGESMRRLIEDLGVGPRVPDRAASVALTSGVAPPPREQQIAGWAMGEILLHQLGESGAGLLITVDEIHAADRRELEQLATTVQHFVRKRLPIELVLAGLPAGVSGILNECTSTFIRRATRLELGSVGVSDVATSFRDTFAEAGFDSMPSDIQSAAEATGGYPFLVQLVGYFLFREVETNGSITTAAVDRAIERANNWYARTALAAASPGDDGQPSLGI